MRRIIFGAVIALLGIGFLTSCKKESAVAVPEKKVTYQELEAAFANASRQAKEIISKRKAVKDNAALNGVAGTGSPVTGLEDPITLTDAEALSVVQPLIEPSASYLSSEYNINVYADLAPGDPGIAQLGALALKLTQLEMQNKSLNPVDVDNWNVGGTPIQPIEAMSIGSNPGGPELMGFAASEPSILDCALDALGIPAGMIVGAAKDTSRKALLKAAKKLATRTLGIIGAAIAIYEFGDCMDWW
jgi:hypothetical protein